MKKQPFIYAFPLMFFVACHSKPSYYLSPDTRPYEAFDLTKENTFSNNIEGPAFRHDTLFVVNYKKDGTIGMVFPGGRCETYITLPKGSTANSIKFDPAGNMYLADFTRHNILKVDMDKQVSIYCHHDKFNQPNDICMNSKGWIYASDPNWKNGTGQVWLIKQDRVPELVATMGTSNGITLSPDEKQLYVDESNQLKIWKFDVDSSGRLSDKRLFASFKDYSLDGMHFGPEGNLYVCRYGKGTMDVFNTEGEKLREIDLKGKDNSNFVFGDPDGKTGFVTLQDRKCMEMFRIE